MPHNHHKLHNHYYGPYKVLEHVSPVVAYKLQLSQDAKIHDIVHVSLLKPAYSNVQATSVILDLKVPAEPYPQAVLD